MCDFFLAYQAQCECLCTVPFSLLSRTQQLLRNHGLRRSTPAEVVSDRSAQAQCGGPAVGAVLQRTIGPLSGRAMATIAPLRRCQR